MPVPLQPIDGAIISNFATATYTSNEALEKIAPQDLPKVFPTPVSYQQNNEAFLLNNTFSINADAAFNKEAEKTIRNIKGKWMPAKLNGKNVRSYFNFPISMQFE